MLWRNEHSLLSDHTRNVLFVVLGKTEKSIDKSESVINNVITIVLKTSPFDLVEDFFFADKVVVSTMIKITK